MKHINTQTLQSYDRFYRGNLINSITGYKSANLLATKSASGIDNVAIFSSVTHLGSDPALFSFVQRPLGHGVGHTYENLKETNSITLNHLTYDLINSGHQSSSKYPEHESEFDILNIAKIERDTIYAPFVKTSLVQVAAQYEGEYLIKENNCILVLCRITDIFYPENIQHEDGFLQLDLAKTVSINGLDGYAMPILEKRLSYAQAEKKLETIWSKK